MSAYYPQNSSGMFSRRAIVFVAILVFHAIIIYAFATGLATSGARIINTILQTNIIQTQKQQELPPPPPKVDLKVAPPVQVIAPDVQITLPVAAPPPITRTAPVVKAAPPPVIHAPPAPIQSVRVTYAPDPEDYYPDSSRRNNEEGRALVHICVDVRGRVTEASVSSGTGHPLLDDAAVKLAKAYRFKPATQSGHAIAQCTGLPVKFQLTGGG